MFCLRSSFNFIVSFHLLVIECRVSAQHTDPDYSCAYVTVKTNGSTEGYGLTFTCGRGTEIVAMAVKALRSLVVGRKLRADIFARFGAFWRELTSESQLRWVSLNILILHRQRKATIFTRRLDQKKVSCIWLSLPLSTLCGICGLVSKTNRCGVCSPTWNQK